MQTSTGSVLPESTARHTDAAHRLTTELVLRSRMKPVALGRRRPAPAYARVEVGNGVDVSGAPTDVDELQRML
jgi:hypothetical protein